MFATQTSPRDFTLMPSLWCSLTIWLYMCKKAEFREILLFLVIKLIRQYFENAIGHVQNREPGMGLSEGATSIPMKFFKMYMKIVGQISGL